MAFCYSFRLVLLNDTAVCVGNGPTRCESGFLVKCREGQGFVTTCSMPLHVTSVTPRHSTHRSRLTGHPSQVSPVQLTPPALLGSNMERSLTSHLRSTVLCSCPAQACVISASTRHISDLWTILCVSKLYAQ